MRNSGEQERDDEHGTSDNESTSAKKRSRPETAALQLLELAGASAKASKRLKSVVLPIRRKRQNSVASTSSQTQSRIHPLSKSNTGTVPRIHPNTTPTVGGQFEDASSEEEMKDHAQEESLIRTEIIVPSKQKQQLDGQFDDASEGDDTPNLEFFVAGSHDGAARRGVHPLSALTAPPPASLARQQQQRQQILLQQQVVPAPVPLYPSLTVFPPGATTFWGAFQPIAPRFDLQAPQQNNNSNNVPVPVAPRPVAAPTRTTTKQLKDGPLGEKHPNPLLLPDSRIDESARLRPMPPVPPDVLERKYPVLVPLPTDILLGRGARSNRHVGNAWFREFIQAYRPAYQQLEKFNKMQLATNLVNYVRHCGGRFLQKKPPRTQPGTPNHQQNNAPEVWWEVGDTHAIQKCSQCLREQGRATPPQAAAATVTAPLTQAPLTTAPNHPRKVPAAASTKGAASKSGKSNRRAKSTKETTGTTDSSNVSGPTAGAVVGKQARSEAEGGPRRPSNASTTTTNATDIQSDSKEETRLEEEDDDNDNNSLGLLEI